MYNWNLLERPLPFTSGNLSLWSNEYIANNVIRRHLDGNVDSGSRKKDTILKASKWIASKLIEKGCILDIGCGPGLYADLLCDYGFRYYGIDVSYFQIEYAIKYHKSEMASFAVMDFRKFNPVNQYCGTILLYAIYSLYNFEDRINLLKKIKNSLIPGGIIIIEVFTKQHYINRKEVRDWEYIEKNGFWSQTPYLELNAFYRYDDIDLYLVQAAMVQDDIYVWNAWTQTFTPDALINELRIAGFMEFELYSTCTGEPYNDKSDVICICAK